MKRILLFALLSSFLLCSLSGQQKLSNLNTSWSQVLGGKFISKPVLTPYGFIGATDGRTIASISNNGMILWEQNIPVSSTSIINTISDDFTLAVTNENKKITLLNPSGVPLWSKVLDEEITDKAYEGRDGRFFLRGKNIIYCFGINGICKWMIKTEEQSSIPIQELNDGSLIFFLKELSDKKTRALRITPFGKPLEDITFAGEILNACTTKDGIFLTFYDGAAGLFSLDMEENKAVNKFVLNKDIYQKSQLNYFCSDRRLNNGVFVTQKGKGASLFFIDSDKGMILWQKDLPDLNLKNIKEAKLTQQGFFICDTERAFYFNNEGILLWNSFMPESKNRSSWKQALFTNSNTLVIFKDNWTMDAYIVNQTVSSINKEKEFDYYLDYLKVDSSVYSNLYFFEFNSEVISPERCSKLESGFYGEDEIKYTSDILSAAEAYMKENSGSQFGGRTELSVFKTNTSQVQSLLNQLPFYGTRYTTNLTAKLLRKETNNSLLNSLLSGLQKDGYDPDGEILEALEILAGKTSTKNINTQLNICDAVYSVCRFMGRPAYNKSGKTILKNFMYPANDSRVRIKARETLEMIGRLEK